jgi:oxygen-dependent protoporphyrinogen oxidase
MPRFQEMERRRRSVTWAMYAEQRERARQRETGSGARWSLFVTLADGMQELVGEIARRLEGSLRCQTQAAGLEQMAGKWRVLLADGSILGADGVIVATPAFQAARLLKFVSREAAAELEQICYASTATVSLAYRASDFPRQPDSFGFVVPAIEQRRIMACTFSSLKYPGRAPAGSILLRAFVGGALQPELFALDDAMMVNNVRSELADLLGVTAEPLLQRIWRYPNSMPQYHVGHQARIARIENALSSLSSLALAGSAYNGVGIADCVRTAELAAEKIAASLAPAS